MDPHKEAPRTSAEDVAELLADMFDAYPMDEGPTTTIALTGPDGKTHEVKADPDQLGWLGNLVVAGHADADRSHDDHPDHGVCAHCEKAPKEEGPEPEAAEHAATLHTLAPTAEELAAEPALVALIGGTITGHEILESYPAEWVVSVEDPEIPGQDATELGTNIADTPLTARLRERLPVVLAPHPNTLGELASVARADILAVAATYGVPAYAVLTNPAGATNEEFQALPTPTALAAEGWLSY
ncbi:hypothetical protein NE857_34015 (plasmid) [Nocardiopsis exhalans]|uniref:Uncharacterized protein n=1 Tax=Nocardiopsis exhalans TaxID=163604 RepID=A0ABY5DHU8_9ACTN|nr:hypothetical protein [Nocardiopsis exhalans]USY23550.1 hypothetical protein NE857_34015 [Nocardiopsis exhalans]